LAALFRQGSLVLLLLPLVLGDVAGLDVFIDFHPLRLGVMPPDLLENVGVLVVSLLAVAPPPAGVALLRFRLALVGAGRFIGLVWPFRVLVGGVWRGGGFLGFLIFFGGLCGWG